MLLFLASFGQKLKGKNSRKTRNGVKEDIGKIIPRESCLGMIYPKQVADRCLDFRADAL